MIAAIYLACAIACEVAATSLLRVAALGRPRWYIAVGAGYVLAFGFLSLSLARGFGLGAAYGIWTATGVALTAIVSRYAFGERISRTAVGGIILIIVGVALVEAGAQH